jgi:hypothetical protein
MPPQNHHQKHPHSRKNSGPREDQKGYSTSEAIIALKDELIEEVHATREKKPEKDTAHRVIEFITLLFVILTTVGVGIQDLILHSSDETFKDTLLAQKDTNERQLRAYVGIRPLGIDNFGEANQVLHTVRKNYGTTPASDLFMDQPNIAILPRNGQFNPAICEPVPTRIVNTLALFPGQELRFEMKTNLNMTKEQIASVRNGSQYQLQFWGTIHYKDIFGKQRCTRYCWGFYGPSMAENDSEYCLQHNDAY